MLVASLAVRDTAKVTGILHIVNHLWKLRLQSYLEVATTLDTHPMSVGEETT